MTASALTRLRTSLPNSTFPDYQLDDAYDEMFDRQEEPREHYHALYRTLLNLRPEELRKSQQAADLSFLHQGINFHCLQR